MSQEQSARNNRQPKLIAPVIPTYGSVPSAVWFMEILRTQSCLKTGFPVAAAKSSLYHFSCGEDNGVLVLDDNDIAYIGLLL